MGTVGERIKLAREKKGLKQEKLGELIGTHTVTISRWERGINQPNSDTLNRIAHALEISVAYLTGETDDPKRYTSRLLELVGTDGNESSLVKSEHGALGDSEAVARLIYERPNGERLDLPDTPENRELFEKLVIAMMTDSVKKELSDSPRSGGIAQSA